MDLYIFFPEERALRDLEVQPKGKNGSQITARLHRDPVYSSAFCLPLNAPVAFGWFPTQESEHRNSVINVTQPPTQEQGLKPKEDDVNSE